MNYQRSQVHQKKLSPYLKITLWVIGGFLCILWWISSTWDALVKTEKTLSIPKGTTIAHLDSHLRAKVSHLRYRLWNMIFAPDISLQSGIFLVPEGTNTLEEIFTLLQNPTPTEEDIIILPGWHKGEIQEAFARKNIEWDLLQQEREIIQNLSKKYPFLNGKESLEWFLMPDTYRINSSTTITSIVDIMLNNFDKRIYQPFLASGKPPEAFYDVLSLASIVWEEEKSVSQLEIVANILKKRLRQWWHIGADITVCYPELIPWSECQKYVNRYYSSPLSERNNTYDTRSKIGLPPTPIANMTWETFLTTLHATAEIEAWYYLHDAQGVIRTAKTETEHEQNKAQYLR